MKPSKEEIDIATRAAAAFERVGNASAAAELRSLFSAAAPQVVADERAAFEAYVRKVCHMPPDARINWDAEWTKYSWDTWQARAALAAAPVQAQEPVAEIHCQEFHELAMDYRGASFSQAPVAYESLCEYIKRLVTPVQPVAAPDATIVLSGHQLRMALDLINPGGPDERDELDDQLLFGIRQHRDDDGNVRTDMCCWNGDTDGVLPLDGEYETPAAPAAQSDAETDMFLYGVIAALGALAPHSRHGDVIHDEIVRSVGKEVLYRVASTEDVIWAALDPEYHAAIAAKAAS